MWKFHIVFTFQCELEIQQTGFRISVFGQLNQTHRDILDKGIGTLGHQICRLIIQRSGLIDALHKATQVCLAYDLAEAEVRVLGIFTIFWSYSHVADSL